MPYKAGMIVRIKRDAFKETTDDQLIGARGLVGRLVYRRGYQGCMFIWDWLGPDGLEIELCEEEIEQIIREPETCK